MLELYHLQTFPQMKEAATSRFNFFCTLLGVLFQIAYLSIYRKWMPLKKCTRQFITATFVTCMGLLSVL